MENRDRAHGCARGLSRGHVAGLLLLAACFLSNGFVATAPQGARDEQEPSREAAVVRFVSALNPALSSREAERIGRAVLRYSSAYGLDVDLVLGVLHVESSARPWVRSPKGAMGLMQIMPHVVDPLDVAGNHTTIESNVELGCLILAHNIRRLGEEDGISAYFWGSEIRGASYLERVRAARSRVRRLLDS